MAENVLKSPSDCRQSQCADLRLHEIDQSRCMSNGTRLTSCHECFLGCQVSGLSARRLTIHQRLPIYNDFTNCKELVRILIFGCFPSPPEYTEAQGIRLETVE